MKIQNHKDLERAFRENVLKKLFITPEAEAIIKHSLEENVGILVDTYGDEGGGGYIKIIQHSISTEEGRKEYLEELQKFNLEASGCEFNDLLVSSDTEKVFCQLFAMTEYNLVILYLMKGEDNGVFL